MPPGITRLLLIANWFFQLMDEQVDPGRFRLFVPPALWPGWDWAQVNATVSHAARPWADNASPKWSSREIEYYQDPEDYDDIEDEGFDNY